MGVIGKYSITDLEVLTGIKAATIRMWEKRYQVISPLRTETNIRYYNTDHLKQLLNINVLNRAGLKISNIVKLSADEIAAKVKELAFVRVDDEDLFDSLFLSMIDLDEVVFNRTYYRAVSRLGFEDTFRQIVFPFFKKIGLMWQTSTINPAQEHFISNLVRQKLIAAIDSVPLTSSPNARIATLFLPENELHEIGLLFLNYLLRHRGYKTVYLGQALPLGDLPRILEISNTDILIASMSNTVSSASAATLIKNISVVSNHQQVYISSDSLFKLDAVFASNIKIFRDLASLYAAL
jgi:DNA-binding transcriptional MerR regulator